MATTKKAAPKKAAKPAKTRHNGDIVIDMAMTMSDGEKAIASVTITNPAGCMLPSQANDARGVVNAIKGLLAAKYGVNHIK